MNRPLVHLFILMLALPAQYFITLWWSRNGTDQTLIKVKKLVATLQEFCKKWLLPENWLIQLKKLWSYLTENKGECIAVEVMKYRSELGYFGNSPKPRRNRPDNVKYKVGQVFVHKSEDYHGVIIGWDVHAMAPDDWIEGQYGMLGMDKSLEPHYVVLPDRSENDKIQMYINQDDIEIVSHRKIENEIIDDYFEGFDGVAYQPRSFLKQLYPND